MIINNIYTFNWELAIYGMRRPYKSHKKSFSVFDWGGVSKGHDKSFELCKNDIKLMRKLINRGAEHRKFLRSIGISFNMSAPLFVWKHFDTYKIGTVSLSDSTMNKITSKCLYKADFAVKDFRV